MQKLKALWASVALVAAALAPLPALAQKAEELTRGEVRKVDKEAGKITIKHEEIKSLDMPPMTMVFTVKDPVLLDKAKAGDTVRFVAVSDNGKLVVTDIRPAKP